MRVPAEVIRLGDLPSDFVPSTIGLRAEVVISLSLLLRGLDFSRGDEGRYEADSHKIRIRLLTLNKAITEPNKDTDPIQLVSANLRGGEPILSVVQQICWMLNISAFDDGAGVRIDVGDDPLRGANAANDYSEQVRHRNQGADPSEPGI